MIGPVPGKKYSEIVFPILSPDPVTKKDVHLLKYPIYVGGNRGRGQIYLLGRMPSTVGYQPTL
jgi:apocytochrome f